MFALFFRSLRGQATLPGRVLLLLVLSALCCVSHAAESAEVIVNSIGLKLVPIPPGEFLMGQDGPETDYRMDQHPDECDRADWDEKPAHRVRITRGFHLGETEVTLGSWRQFQPGFRADDGDDDEAVTGINWNSAVAFCEWLSKKEGRPYRLPTEAEWEYACRAGTASLFSSGDQLPNGSQKWFRDENRRTYYFKGDHLPAEYTLVPGRPKLKVRQSDANPWGLYDMHGNVWEWCSDWYGPYEAGVQVDPVGRSEGDFRIFRGGAHSRFSRMLRSANRGAWIPESKDNAIGFRIVLGEAPKTAPLSPAPAPLHAQHVSTRPVEIPWAPGDTPFFEGPKSFVIIPPESNGPLFSWHNHSPCLTECPNGDLLAVWFSCADEGGSELNNLASRLRYGAKQWEPASPFWDGADVNDHAPKLWWDGKQTLYHFARGLSENVVRTSQDSGATWSKARVILPHGEFGNQLLCTKAGQLYLAHDVRTVSVVKSADGGVTWSAIEMAKTERADAIAPGNTVGRPPGIHAPLVELTDGSLMAISRQDPEQDQARFHGCTPMSVSKDGGRTWVLSATDLPAISSAQRAAMMRLKEGPIVVCSYTDQGRDWKQRKGMTFQASDGSQFTGYGLFAAVSFDEGKTWPVRRLITPGGAPQELPSIDRRIVTYSDTTSEPTGYLAIIQARDGRIHLVSSKNHYSFNLAWLKALPVRPTEGVK